LTTQNLTAKAFCAFSDLVLAGEVELSIVAVAFGASLTYPPGSSVIVGAVGWLEGTFLGTIATTAAVISVAGVGFMALSGRIEMRRALTVVGGCFILFGASSITAGIQAAALGGAAARDTPSVSAVEPSPLTKPFQTPPDYDPYAGAAVPVR
jgi:type IV secretion system protein VirB2